jgi:hypothetical protein
MARLADDSNEGKKKSEFFLVIRPHQVCPICVMKSTRKLEGLPPRRSRA